LFCAVLSFRKEIQKGGYLLYQLVQEIGILLFKGRDLPHPETGLMGIDLDKTILVITAEDKFTEELHFPFVLALGLEFVPVGGTQIFDALGKLLFVEQYLVNTYQQLVGPVRIELACKAIIGQIGKVVAKDFLEPFEEGAFPGVPFGGYQTEDGEHLHRSMVQEFQIVQSQLQLISEDMLQKAPCPYYTSLFRFMRQRGISIVETMVFLFEIDMTGNTGEPIIFGHLAQIVLAMVLLDDMLVPRDQLLVKMSRNGRILYNFIERSANADVWNTFRHGTLILLIHDGTFHFFSRIPIVPFWNRKLNSQFGNRGLSSFSSI